MIDTKLQTFITVTESRSYTRASEILCITQPAVSQHIRALEEYYGVKLILKSGKKMELTAQGQYLYKQACRLHYISKNTKQELSHSCSIRRKYHIGATLTIGGFVLPRLISAYKKKHPNIDLILQVNNTQLILEKVEKSHINLGLIEGPFNKKNVTHEKFKDDELVLIVSRNHSLARKGDVTLQEVLKEEMILREEGSGTRQVFVNALIQAGYAMEDLNIYMEVGDINAILSLVAANLGCTVISRETLAPHLEFSGLQVIPIKDFVIKREFNFIFKDDFHKDFIEDFIQFCREFDC